MSKFIDSFKREVGKNTGKYLSNVLFGDGHSTPYRRVGDKVKLKNSEAKIERSNNEQLFAIDSAVLKNVDKIATIRFSNDPNEIIQQLMELEIHLNSNKWQNVSIGDNKEAIIRNKFCDALFEKYKQGVRILKKMDPSNVELDRKSTRLNSSHVRISYAVFCL